VVKLDGGAVRGANTDAGEAFLGLPYAAAPVGRLRWRAPQPPQRWKGVRDATTAAPNCPQRVTPWTPADSDEDCLYLNVHTPARRTARGDRRPVLVWIHGGGFTVGQGADYDAAKLAADGTVVVTINYRLGALGFLAHPALARHRGGASGNYGLMDQQAALRWVQRNISRFGGDPSNVTIAGQSAGGLSVLMQLASRGARGLFDRAIVQSGAFAPHQKSLATAEAEGKAFAAEAGCPDQSAACLRDLPVSALVGSGGNVIPGVVDGEVLKESVGSALTSGHFNRVPIINGTNQDEERLLIVLTAPVIDGSSVMLPEAISPASYRRLIASTFNVSAARTAQIAAAYPVDAYPTAALAYSAAASDANFACPALELDQAVSRFVPTYAYEFNDANAPERFLPALGPTPAATHQSELQYLFDLPNAVPGTLGPDQQTLAATMRRAWASFAASAAPGHWPAFDGHRRRMLSLVPPAPLVRTDFATRHNCGFWARTR
jgi:para-nitrobenzyl esterase